jgi:hypothetical protein
MAVQVKISVRKNALTGESLASANIVNLQQMDFAEFCDYLSQDSTVGAADVAAVMTQLEKKLPLLIGMGTKVQISQEGMSVKPTVSGSLTQSALKAKLEAKKAAGEDVDVNRELKSSDLTVADLTAGVSIDFSKKFKSSFAQSATLKRTNTGVVEASDGGSSSSSSDSSSSSSSSDKGSSSDKDTDTDDSTEF